jgi:hypothetical protein
MTEVDLRCVFEGMFGFRTDTTIAIQVQNVIDKLTIDLPLINIRLVLSWEADGMIEILKSTSILGRA